MILMDVMVFCIGLLLILLHHLLDKKTNTPNEIHEWQCKIYDQMQLVFFEKLEKCACEVCACPG